MHTAWLPAWLLPDASQEVLVEGWSKAPYRPRHGKPPLVLRAALAAAGAAGLAQQRCLGTGDEEGLSRTPRTAS